MADHRRQVEAYLKSEIPKTFDSRTISQMCADLQKDMDLIASNKDNGQPRLSQKRMEMLLHQKHRRLSFSYPGLFFKIVRGEVDPHMLKSLLTLKGNLDDKSISLEAARNRVIDCAKTQIEGSRGKPRTRKAKPAGTVVQELRFECKPEDS